MSKVLQITTFRCNKRGITLSKSKLYDANKKYMKMYSDALMYLYDMNFQSSPSVFDSKEFFKCISEEYPTMINQLISPDTQKISTNYEHFGFISEYFDYSGEFNDFYKAMKYYRTILKCEKAFKFFGNIYSRVKFPKTLDTATVKCNFGVSNKVYDRSVLELDSEFLAEIIDTDKKVEKVDFSEVFREALDRRYNINLNVSGAYVTSAIRNDIYTGLSDVIKKYYRDFTETNTTSTTCISFFEDMFLYCLDDINEMLTSLNIADENLLYATSEALYYTKDEEPKVSEDESKVLFCKDYITGEDLNLGIQGEFISQKDIERNGFITRGIPVSQEIKYYPIYNVFDEDEILVSNLVLGDISA